MQALSLGLQPGRRLPASTVADMSLLSQPPWKKAAKSGNKYNFEASVPFFIYAYYCL